MKAISHVYHVEWCQIAPKGIAGCGKASAGGAKVVSLHSHQEKMTLIPYL